MQNITSITSRSVMFQVSVGTYLLFRNTSPVSSNVHLVFDSTTFPPCSLRLIHASTARAGGCVLRASDTPFPGFPMRMNLLARLRSVAVPQTRLAWHPTIQALRSVVTMSQPAHVSSFFNRYMSCAQPCQAVRPPVVGGRARDVSASSSCTRPKRLATMPSSSGACGH
jgi:hypothetical protein